MKTQKTKQLSREKKRMVEAARAVYLKFGGRRHEEIEREMRAAGWPFSREVLYTRRRKGVVVVGWPEWFGWNEMLTPDEQVRVRRTNAGRNEFERWLVETQTVGKMEWKWDYQRLLYEKLAAVTAGNCKRLMIFMPPRHGKSELVTIRYTAWRLMMEPGLNVILGSYNQRLANKFSRRIQRVVESGELRVESKNHPVSPERLPPLLCKEGSPENHPVSSERLPPLLCKEGSPENHPVSPERLPPLLCKEGCLGGSANYQLSAVKYQLPSHRRLRSVSEWETWGGGVVRSVGVGGGIAGFGASLVVIDDPVRNRAAAESKNNRETVDEWFKSDIYTRLEPDGAIILIQTRWHEDDLAGRLLKEMRDGGEEWDVVCLPAIADGGERKNHPVSPERLPPLLCKEGSSDVVCLPALCESGGEGEWRSGGDSHAENSPLLPDSSTPQLPDPLGRRPGQALCPERYDVKALERIRRKLGTYAFSALYQQSPTLAEGGQFKRAWFTKVIDYMPVGLNWKRGYDLAVSTRSAADYTASFRVAMDKNGILYIADGFRAKIEYPEQRRYIIERMRSEEATEHGIEAALHGKAVVQELRREPELRRHALREVAVSADKLTRALAWLNLAEEGKIILVRGAWIGDFIEEVAAFPTGRHDDQIDAVSTAVNMLNGVRKARFYTFD